MNFLKKLFGSEGKDTNPGAGKTPDNTKLIYLLDIYGQHPSPENYKNVVTEISNGNCFLLLPTINDEEGIGGWQIAHENRTIKMASVYNQDGLKVLGAFSDENALLNWAKQPTAYTAIGVSAVTDICQQNCIGRIVINSGQKNMFVLQRNKPDVEEITIAEGTEMYVGAPARPLDRHIIDKLTINFRNVNSVEEVYQYLQVANKEASIVLGVKMSVVSDNSKFALFSAVNDALKSEKTEYPVDISIFETDEALQLARGVRDSLIYKK